MRVRIALGLAFLATAIGLAIDMSGSASRLAGDDKTPWPPPLLTGVVPGGSRLCIASTVLPDDAASLQMTIGSFGRPLPPISAQFTAAGRRVATGALAPGAKQGENVAILLRYPHGPSVVGTLCLRIGGRRANSVEFGGENYPGTGSATTVDGAPVIGRPSILYYRPGQESWWSLLGVLDLRFGLGKSPIFGDWTLPVIALAALALWFGVTRLLLRELR